MLFRSYGDTSSWPRRDVGSPRFSTYYRASSLVLYRATQAIRMSELKLVFDEPKQRKKAPEHLADLTKEERRAKAESLGLPAFRANQISTHYFTHYNDDPESWTDIPAALRPVVAEHFLPKLITLVRSITCDNGKTRKDLWRLHDGVLDRKSTRLNSSHVSESRMPSSA